MCRLALHVHVYTSARRRLCGNVLRLVRINTQAEYMFWHGIYQNSHLSSGIHWPLFKILVRLFFTMTSYFRWIEKICSNRWHSRHMHIPHCMYVDTWYMKGGSVPYRRTKIDRQIYPRKFPASPVYSFILNGYVSGDDWSRWWLHIDADGQIH
jgi:hypothetical protein